MRLLLNLVEVVFARRADIRSAEAHRALLAGILDAFTSKLSSLHHRLPQLLSYGPPSSPFNALWKPSAPVLQLLPKIVSRMANYPVLMLS